MGIASILGDVGAFSNPFGAAAGGEWNITRGVYVASDGSQIVLFFETPQGENPSQKTAIDQTIDSGGRRVAIYEYPYVDGQKTEDLGRKGETYTFNLKFFGLNYQTKLNLFIDIVINDPGPGTLNHPTLSPIRGSFPVRFRDYEFVHRYDEVNAVTIKAVFVEDNTGDIQLKGIASPPPDSLLRQALQMLSNIQSLVSTLISTVGALLLLPGSIITALKERLASIIGQVSRLLGQLAATFSSNSKVVALAAQSSSLTGGIPSLTSGSVAVQTGSNLSAQLPPVYQVGFDPTTQAAVTNQINNFVKSNKITPQQAIFATNQIREAITKAIAEVNTILGNDGYPIMLQYRALATSIQEAVQSCIAIAQAQVKIYTTPSAMSLRMVAIKNGLAPDRQNDIEALNTYIGSVNYIPKGTQITVPAV